MDKELIDRSWACLPREFREEVKKIYNADDPLVFPEENGLLDYIFGEHNLTYDAEGEEMLMVSRKQIDVLQGEIFKAIMDAHDADDWQDAAHYILDVVSRSFAALFGPKCLPGGNSSNVDEIGKDCNVESSESKPAEPKFEVGDKVMYKGVLRVIDLIDTVTHRYHLSNGNYYAEWVDESDLEPYTEPEEEASPNVNHSDINIDELVAKGYVPDPAKQFDNILKDGFRNERRLNIAVQMVKAITQCPEIVERIASAEADSLLDDIVDDALHLTDRLIDECEKGGSK